MIGAMQGLMLHGILQLTSAPSSPLTWIMPLLLPDMEAYTAAPHSCNQQAGTRMSNVCKKTRAFCQSRLICLCSVMLTLPQTQFYTALCFTLSHVPVQHHVTD